MDDLYYETDAQGRGIRIWRHSGDAIFSVYPPIVTIPLDKQTPQQRITEYNDQPGVKVTECRRPIGAYHPRIFRPLLEPYEHHSKAPYDIHAKEAGVTQLSALAHALQRVCRTVEPIGCNLQAYGHDIRNLLILACTEVEAQLRAILIANGYARARTTTDDYVKLLPELQLIHYSLQLVPYPALAPIAPFKDWSSNKPTQSLPWYSSYNNVKHSREEHFSEASLTHCIDSVCACAILLVAQYGSLRAFPGDDFFRFVDSPRWTYDQKYLLPMPDTSSWRLDLLQLD